MGAAAAGLIVYGATTQEKLQGVVGQPPDDEKLKRQLAEEGVPKAICDILLGKYVAPSKGEPKMPFCAPEEVATEYLDGVLNGKQLARPAFKVFPPRSHSSCSPATDVRGPERQGSRVVGVPAHRRHR